MTVSEKPRAARKQHSQPIYLVSFDGQTLTTNTASGRNTVDFGGTTYRQTINNKTGACTCGCPGFQESIAPRAHRAGITPTLANEKTCCHIRAAADFGKRHGYIPADVEAPAAFDYVSYFESM